MADFTKQHVEKLFAHLKLLNVYSFTLDFDGSGDDGQIHQINFLDSEGVYMDIPEDSITWVYNEERGEEQVSLYKCAEDLGYQMLDESGHDWYNNDGGYGEITISLDDGTGKPSANMNMNIRYVDTDEYQYDNENFTMFAEEGEHKKTDNRELMDKLLDEIKERA